MGMSVERISARVGLDQPAIVIQLAFEGLVSQKTLNDAIFEGARSSLAESRKKELDEQDVIQDKVSSPSPQREEAVEDDGLQF
jgi:hypothetical protein